LSKIDDDDDGDDDMATCEEFCFMTIVN